jgi:GTP pyrophosphokinase
VLGPGEQPVEVLIRTVSMHHASELGIAANFRGGPVGAVREIRPESQTQLGWLRRVVDWQQSVDDAEKFIDALRCDLTERQIQVFTSAGHSVLLPVDATPVDFAYTLGPALGHACVGAAINGRLVPLSSRLGDGDVVEVITRRAATDRAVGPALEWLGFVRSPQARLEIRRWFDEAQDEDEPTDSQETIAARVARGRTEVGSALRREGRWLAGDGPMYELAAHLGYPEVDAVYVAVADGKLAAAEVVTQLIALVDRARPPLAG